MKAGAAIAVGCIALLVQVAERAETEPLRTDRSVSKVVICDGRTDSAPAINAALDSIRVDKMTRSARLDLPSGTCLIKSTINMTGLKRRGILIDGHGATIVAQTAGRPAVDAMNTQFLEVRSLTIKGDGVASPSIGLQLGRVDDADQNSADNNYFSHLSIFGFFSFAALVDLNAETTLFDKLDAVNESLDVNSFTVVLDGTNNFAIKSEFVAAQQKPHQAQSFNETTFVSADIRHNGRGTPLWVAHATRLSFIRSYAFANAGSQIVQLYSGSKRDESSFIAFDLHTEARRVTPTFAFAGPNKSRSIFSLSYQDQLPAGDVFTTGGCCEIVDLPNLKLVLGGLRRGNLIFPRQSSWNVSGTIELAREEDWDPAASRFSGTVTAGLTQQFYFSSRNAK